MPLDGQASAGPELSVAAAAVKRCRPCPRQAAWAGLGPDIGLLERAGAAGESAEMKRKNLPLLAKPNNAHLPTGSTRVLQPDQTLALLAGLVDDRSLEHGL